MKKYDIAAYVWPAYTGNDPRARLFWEEGIGEWQTLKNTKQKANGYLWTRKPAWGYVNEADPYVMCMQIEAAVEHGVNVFIYDWYWYEHMPFLENCLNDGFLKAPNCNKMKFYIMWANHDVNYTWSIRHSDGIDANIWNGTVGREEFEIIGKRWIEKYFLKENYYKIDGKPVVSIYNLNNLVTGLGGIENAIDAMQWLDKEAKMSGLKGVHFQFVCWSESVENLSGVDGETMETTAQITQKMGFESLTHYQFAHFVDIDREYELIVNDAVDEWDKISKNYDIPFFPHVSVGWDNNLRFRNFKPGILKNNTPENFEKALKEAKKFADEHDVQLITINSWNEWTEASYLEPDDLYGYAYLQAIKRTFKEER